MPDPVLLLIGMRPSYKRGADLPLCLSRAGDRDVPDPPEAVTRRPAGNLDPLSMPSPRLLCHGRHRGHSVVSRPDDPPSLESMRTSGYRAAGSDPCHARDAPMAAELRSSAPPNPIAASGGGAPFPLYPRPVGRIATFFGVRKRSRREETGMNSGLASHARQGSIWFPLPGSSILPREEPGPRAAPFS